MSERIQCHFFRARMDRWQRIVVVLLVALQNLKEEVVIQPQRSIKNRVCSILLPETVASLGFNSAFSNRVFYFSANLAKFVCLCKQACPQRFSDIHTSSVRQGFHVSKSQIWPNQILLPANRFKKG